MKKIIFLVLSGIIALSASAQTLTDGNKISDNWSVGFNAGAITPLTHSAFFKNMRSTFGVEANKQLTPIFGLGIESMWGINTTPSATAFDHSNISILGKININNLIWGYTGAPRCFEVEAVAGMGWLHTYALGNGDANAITSKFGLNFNFNLGEEKAWTIAVKPALAYNLEGRNTGATFHANYAAVELTAGLIYHFKGSNGKRYMSLAKAYDQAEVDGLNNNINSLRSEAQANAEKAQTAIDSANKTISDLQDSLTVCKNKAPIVETVTSTNKTLESVITFRQGRTSVDASQTPNVERIATYMKNQKDSKVTIKGYASPEGSAEVNARIAKQRADAVKSMLINRYKIAASRITSEGQGVGAMFSEPDWNRVSICTLN